MLVSNDEFGEDGAADTGIGASGKSKGTKLAPSHRFWLALGIKVFWT